MSGKGDRQRLTILRFIADHIGRNGYAPTLTEIGQAAGRAHPSSVAYHLDLLVEQGRIRRASGSSRALQLVLTPGVVTVPVRQCGACGCSMPADHLCRFDPYGTPNDLYAP